MSIDFLFIYLRAFSFYNDNAKNAIVAVFTYRTKNSLPIWLGIIVKDTTKGASSNNRFAFSDGTLVDGTKIFLKFKDNTPNYALTN